MESARIGDPVAHRRAVGPVAAHRLDARVAQAGGEGPWRTLEELEHVEPRSLGTLVSVGALCAGRDLDRSVAIVRRALAPRGRLVFLEHTGRPGPLGLLQRMSDPLWSALPTGCHVDHDVVAALRGGGFVVLDLERCTLPSVLPILRPWVQGVAMAEEEDA